MSAIQAVIAVLCSDVKEIITHKNPDWDSVVSVFLLRQWGRAMFVNIEKAVIRFSEKTVLGTDADHDRDGVVPVDTGKGRFSEHCGPTGRLLNKCAAVLVAEFLKIAGRPELARLLEETRNADNKAEGTATSIPTLMKTAYRCGASQGLVFGWASKMVEAIVRHQQYQYEAVAGEKTLLQWFQLLVEEDGSVLAKEGKPHDAIVRAIQDSMALKDRRVLELSYVVEALQRTVSDKSDIKCLLRFWFGMMQNDQEMFQAEGARIRPIRKFMTERRCTPIE